MQVGVIRLSVRPDKADLRVTGKLRGKLQRTYLPSAVLVDHEPPRTEVKASEMRAIPPQTSRGFFVGADACPSLIEGLWSARTPRSDVPGSLRTVSLAYV